MAYDRMGSTIRFPTKTKRPKKQQRKTKVGFALQGGGSYGAYAKGVLTTLFKSEAFSPKNITIKAITGTSAGAVNGALTTYGLHTNGYEGAINTLNAFWDDMAIRSMLPNFHHPNLSQLDQAAARMIPNGYILECLQNKLNKHILDWDSIRKGPVQLFTNAVKFDPATQEKEHIVFQPKQHSAETITAGGALLEFGPYHIGEQQFIDGAYLRNPCTEDILKADIDDLFIISLQKKPTGRIEPFHQDLFHPLPENELITSELHAHIAHIHQEHPKINLHVIGLDVQEAWNDSSRMNTRGRWLNELSETGQTSAQSWLKAHSKKIGKESSYFAEELLLAAE